jgi:hypothetical protein
MAYSQNTIISANAANALVTVLQGLLAAAGWVNVETIIPSGTFRTDVWKSPGASNLAGYDWYTVIKWNTVGTEQCVEVVSGGAYDQPSHTLSQIANNLYCGGYNGGYAEPITGDMGGPYPINAVADLSTQWNSHNQTTQKNWFNAVVPSSAFAYWASVTKDHVSLFTTITHGGDYQEYGHFSTLTVDPAWEALAYTAKNPVVGLNQYGYGISASLLGNPTDILSPTVKVNGTRGTVLPTLSDSYQVAYAWREAFYLYNVYARVPVTGWAGGSFHGLVYIGSVPDTYTVLGGSIGDTVDIGGATYVICPMGAPVGGIDTPTLAVLVE